MLNELDDELKNVEKQIIGNKKPIVDLTSRQIFNPQWGNLHFRDDGTMYITYNPFDKIKPTRYIKKYDEYSVEIFNVLQTKYKEKPKEAEVDNTILFNKIKELQPEIDPKIIFDKIYNKENQKVKFRLFTEDKKTVARILLDKNEKFVKNFCM